jgi:LacI family transcriptional regulator
VSRALKDNPRISEDTTRLVKDMAKKLGFQLNGVASALRSGRTNTIGVIVPTADRSFFSSVIRGIEEITNKTGYNLMICQSNDKYESERDNLEALLRARVDGIILSIAKKTFDYKHYENLKKRGVPLVFFDRVAYDMNVSTVTIDDHRGAYNATQHLIEQGCRRIATLVSESRHLNIYRERLRGYCDALKANNLPVDEELMHFNDLTIDGGKKGAAKLWSLKNKPDAFLCQSDFSAVGAMQFLKEEGIKIPKDVAIIGFANEPFTSFIEPFLTTVDQHPIEMGQTAAKLFFEQLESPNGDFVPKNITLNADLIIRQSSLFGQ